MSLSDLSEVWQHRIQELAEERNFLQAELGRRKVQYHMKLSEKDSLISSLKNKVQALEVELAIARKACPIKDEVIDTSDWDI